MIKYLLSFCFLMSLASYANLECQLAEIDEDGIYGQSGLAYAQAIKIDFKGCSKSICSMDITCTLNGEKMMASSAICQPLEDGTCPSPTKCFTEVNGIVGAGLAPVNTRDTIVTPRSYPLDTDGKVRRQ